MNLKELKDRVDHAFEKVGDRAEGISIGIPNGKNGMGGTPMTLVSNATLGFDWNHSKFFITPEKKMKEAIEEPMNFKEAWDKAIEWAIKQCPKEGYNSEEKYQWVFMYLRDQFNLFSKF